MVLVAIASFSGTFVDGKYHLGERVFMFLFFNIISLIFLIWRYKVEGEIRATKKAIKQQKVEIKSNLEAAKKREKELELKRKEEEKIVKNLEKQELEIQKRKLEQEKEQKLNTPVYVEDKVIYRFGENSASPCTVTIEGNWITITRDKKLINTISHGLDGTKKIHVKNISAIQFKEPGSITAGYIQLVVVGSQENKGGILDATRDENTIMVYEKNIKLARIFIKEIEKMIDELNCNKSHAISQTIKSNAQEIREFKTLLDEGIISQEEFDLKKSQLLE